MSYFDTILADKGLCDDDPLWKIVSKMQDVDLKELVFYIDSHWYDNVLQISREVCLLYAYWWQNNYDGGKGGHTYNRAPVDFKMQHNDEASVKRLTDIIKNELRIYRRLSIPLYQGESGNNRYLDSLFAQGGIPKALLQERNVFSNYLLSLTNYYGACDLNSINWHDNTIAKEKSRYLPSTFQNEAFYNVSLAIVQSIITESDEFVEYAEIRDVINQVKNDYKTAAHSSFRIDWFIDIQGNDACLCYSLQIPNRFKTENNSSYRRRYYLNDSFVAEYILRGNEYVCLSQIPVRYKKTTSSNEVLFLQFYDDNDNTGKDAGLASSTSPLLDEPILTQLEEASYWSLKTDKHAPSSDCLIPYGWEPETEEELSLTPITIHGADEGNYYWCHIDWQSFSAKEIIFRKGDEITRLQQTNDEFDVTLNLPIFDWIVRASSLILPKRVNNRNVNLTDIGRIYVKDEVGNKLDRRSWSIKFKNSTGKYQNYSFNDIPLGKVVFSIDLPHGLHKRFSAFVVEEMAFSSDSEGVSFSCGENTIIALRKENNGIVKHDNHYIINRKNNRQKAIYLLLCANNTTTKLDIQVPSSDSVFVDSEDNEMIERARVSLRELDIYRVYLANQKIRISYVEKKDNRDNTLITSSLFLRPGQYYSLAYTRDVIEKMFCLLGKTKKSEIWLTAGNKTLIVTPNTYDTFLHKENNRYGIQVLRNNNPVLGLRLLAVSLPSNDGIDEVELEENKNGIYLLPDGFDGQSMIVFSRDSSNTITPIRIDLGEDLPQPGDHEAEEQFRLKRDRQKKEAIQRSIELLSIDDEAEWESVWYYLNLVHDYQLAYSTFNCFLALASDPKLLTSFYYRIHKVPSIIRFWRKDIVRELERMEYELGFAFHYIPRNLWCNVQNHIKNDFENRPSIAQDKTIEDYQDLTFCYLKDLIKNQFQFAEDNLIYAMELIVLYGLSLKDPNHNWRTYAEYLEEGVRETYFTNNTNTQRNQDTINLHYQCNPRDYRVIPDNNFKTNARNTSIVQFMQYHCIIMPQVAAQNVFEYNKDFWSYAPDTYTIQRRLINFIRRYAKNMYNDIFYTALNDKL